MIVRDIGNRIREEVPLKCAACCQASTCDWWRADGGRVWLRHVSNGMSSGGFMARGREDLGEIITEQEAQSGKRSSSLTPCIRQTES